MKSLNKTTMFRQPYGKMAAMFLGISLTMLMLISVLSISTLQRIGHQNRRIAENIRSDSAENCAEAMTKLLYESDAAIMYAVRLLLIATLISIILTSTLSLFMARMIAKTTPAESSRENNAETVEQELLAMRQKIDDLLRIMHSRF